MTAVIGHHRSNELAGILAPALPRPVVAPRPGAGARWAERFTLGMTITDSLVVVAAVVGVVGLVHGIGILPASAALIDSTVLPMVAVAAWIMALSWGRTREVRVLGSGMLEFRRVALATAAAAGAVAMAVVVLGATTGRDYLLIGFPVGLVALGLTRIAWRRRLKTQRMRGIAVNRVVVVGDRVEVARTIAQLARAGGSRYDVVGVAVGDGRGAVVVNGETYAAVASFETVARAAAAVNADMVVVAGQPVGGDYLRDLAWSLEHTPTELVVSAVVGDVAQHRMHFHPINGLPLVHVAAPSFTNGRHVSKRALDIMLSAIALVLLSPVMAAVALAIKLDDRGPVLFRQERSGLNGQSFKMLKFRTMVTTAEADLAALMAQNEGAGPLFKLKRDPRITRVGAFLRKYSLDELPQIWNALVGDMSLVGPRPPLAREVEQYEASDHRRLYSKPGITGLWQVSGRSDLSWEQSVRLDLDYVENWSVAGDVRIMWRTVKTVLHPSGAY